MIGECDKSFVESTEVIIYLFFFYIPIIYNINVINFLINIKDELKLMQNVNHNNVIKYFGHEKIDNSLCIYLEYMDGIINYKK